MSSSLFKLVRPFVCLLAFSACARPTLSNGNFQDEHDEPSSEGGNEEHDASALGAHDAGEPAPLDAGHDVATPDADSPLSNDAGSCSDRDHDALCDDEDNCPSVANPDQADGDADGTGDACEQDAGNPGGACGAEGVPAMVTAGDAELSNVRVNGMSSPATVRKGQRLSVSIGYAFGECALPIPGQPRFMVIGLDGRNAGDCQILVEVPCPTRVNAEVTLMLDAPTTAGPAYVVALGRQGFACSDSLNNAKRIAALCVE
jgi:hypothetical protein